MKLDWINFNFFLEMLSVERIEPFISELCLPVDKELLSPVMRLARACLEVDLYNSVGLYKDFSNFMEPWQRYRDSQGVLSEDILAELSACDEKVHLNLDGLFIELQELTGAFKAKELLHWFSNNFRSGPDPVWRWPWAIEMLLTDNPHKPITIPKIVLLRDEQTHIDEFCKHYRAEKKSLEMRFYEVTQAAKLSHPSVWESVLQNYPPDEGTLKYYPWLLSIYHCLEYRLIRHEWSRLTERLSPARRAYIIHWVREQSILLPFSPILPNEPSPL